MTTAPTQPTTITLPVPTSFAVDPARLVAWLEGRGWIPCDEPGYLSKRGEDPIWIPLDACEAVLCEAVKRAASAEGLRPCALAALLAHTADGPAPQWAHARADTRAPVLALLDSEAENHRDWAKEERAAGRTENALHEDGRALGLEAAAAVLRAPSSPTANALAAWRALPESVRAKVLDVLAIEAGKARTCVPPDEETCASWREQARGLDALAAVGRAAARE